MSESLILKIPPDNQPGFEFVKGAVTLDLDFKSLLDGSANLVGSNGVHSESVGINQSLEFVMNRSQPCRFNHRILQIHDVLNGTRCRFPNMSVGGGNHRVSLSGTDGGKVCIGASSRPIR